MKKNVRLVLLFALIAVMLVMTAVFASAADVATADDFKAAVAAGGEITLTDNITLDAGIIIDKDVTINGDGHTITFTAGTALDANVYVTTSTSHADRFVASYAFRVTGGNVTFENVTVSAPADATAKPAVLLVSAATDVTLDGFVSNGGYITVVVDAAAELTIDGATNLGAGSQRQYILTTTLNATNAVITLKNGVIKNDTAITDKGDMIYLSSKVTFNMQGGEIGSGTDAAIYSPAAGTINMTGGTVVGKNGFNTACALNITGGEFATAGYCINVRDGAPACSISGITATGGTPIQLSSKNAVTIDDCTLTSGTGGIAVLAKQTGANGSLTITNSTLTGTDNGGAFSVQSDYGAAITITDSYLYGYAGVRVYAAGRATVNATRVTYRPYAGQGSGVFVRVDGSTTLTGSVFNLTDCDINLTEGHTGEAQDSTGNIVYLTDNAVSVFNLTNCTVVKNGTGNGFNVNNDGQINIKGGSYTYSGTGNMFYISDGSANLSIDGGTFTYNGTSNMLDKRNASTVVIENATLTQNCEGKDLIYTTGGTNGTIIVTNSTLTHSTGGNVLHVTNAALVNFTDVTCEGKVTVEDAISPNIIFTDVTYTEKVDPNTVIVETSAKIKNFELNGTTMTWEDAMAALQAGDTLFIIGAVDWNIVIDTTVTFTLDGNGAELPFLTVAAGANVTLTNITVNAQASVAPAVTVEVGGTATFGEYCALYGAVGADALWVKGTATIDGAELVNDHNDAITNQGTLNFISGYVQVTGTSGDGIYNIAGGIATIGADATIEAIGSGAAINTNGTVTVNGATITATGAGAAIKMNAGSVVTIEYAICQGTIYVIPSAADSKADLTIEDGIYSAGNYYHAQCVNAVIFMNGASGGAANVTINGGSFTNEGTVAMSYTDVAAASSSVIALNDGNASLTITGGTFALTGEGCTIYIRNSKKAAISNATITSEGQAAVFYARSGSNTTLTNTTVSGDTIGVWYGGNHSMTLTDCTINCTTAVRVQNNVTSASYKLNFVGGKIETGANGTLLDIEALSLEEGVEVKPYTVTFNGTMIVDQNATTDSVFGAANVVLTKVIVLTSTAKEIKTGVMLTESSPAVKVAGVKHFLYMTAAGAADAALDNGASVRVDATAEMTGIRFTGSATKVDDAVYGILIAPADYVAAAGAFTKEALDTWADAKSIAVPYVMAEAQKSLHDNGDGTVSFSVALVDIQSRNYGRSFAAVPYVTVGGETTYGDYDSTNNARSMKSVATEALADLLTDAELSELVNTDADKAAKYIYTITIGGVEYASKYSADDRAALEKYIA